jgi:hypothetical protein
MMMGLSNDHSTFLTASHKSKISSVGSVYVLSLRYQRVIDPRCEQMIQHIHRSCEQDALVGLAGFRSDDPGEECFSHARVADEHEVRILFLKRQIELVRSAGSLPV